MSSAGERRWASSERDRVITRERRKRLKFVSPRHAAIRSASRVSWGTIVRRLLEKDYVSVVLRGGIQRRLQGHSLLIFSGDPNPIVCYCN